MARRHVELCRRMGSDEVMVSTVAAPGVERADGGEPFRVHRQAFPYATANRFTNQVRWARWLVRAARGGVDLMHCGNIRPCGYAVWWAHQRTGVPYLVYVNGGDLLRERVKTARSGVKRAGARRILGDAAGIVANSRWTAEITAALLGDLVLDRRPPIATIDLGTDPVQFHPSRDRGLLRRRFALGDAPLMLTVARLVPHKGQDVGIRALARLARELPSLRYVLVGDGHDEPRLRALASELGVADRVVFAGALSDDEVADAYATASLYLGLSRLDNVVNVEGFGISFIEAAASGVPAIAGDSGGVRAAVRDGETGIVVAPTDLDAICDAIRSLLRDAERRRALGAAARRAVEEHYTWDRVALETRAFAHGVLGRAPVAA